MKRLSHAVAIVFLAALVTSCGSRSGTTGPGPGTATQVTPVPSVGGASSGAAPTSAVPQAVVDEHWPREASSGGDHVTVYQPQVDSWDGSLLRAHAAVAVKTGDAKAAPTYGVVWATVRTDVDRETRLVTLRDGLVTRADFPSSPGKQDAYARTIEKAVLHDTVIGLDRLEAALGIHQEAQKGEAMPPRNDPPVIVFSTVPAILVPIDGAARLPARVGHAPRAGHQHSVRSSFGTPAGTHYLHVFDGWMEAPALAGPVDGRPSHDPGSRDGAGGGHEERERRPPRGRRSRRTAQDATLAREGPGARDPRGDDAHRAHRDGGGAGLRPDRRNAAPLRQEHHRQRLQRPAGPEDLRPRLRAVVPLDAA